MAGMKPIVSSGERITASFDSDDYILEPTLFSKFFIFGMMERTDDSLENYDFEVTLLVLIIDGEEIQMLKKGEMIRLHGPMIGIATGNRFIGLIEDWSII